MKFRGLHMLILIGLLGAVSGLVILLICDAGNLLNLPASCRKAGALSLMSIGLAYMLTHVCAGSPRPIQLKQLILGFAFFLWGGEQLLPPASPWVTVMDDAVVLIFVTDLSLLTFQSWKRGCCLSSSPPAPPPGQQVHSD